MTTPIELRDGLYIKREDLYAYANGANGSKLRAAELLVGEAAAAGKTHIITGAACVSPQHALVASAAWTLGIPTVHVLGGTKPGAAQEHTSVRMAAELGAEFVYIRSGFNPQLQREVKRRAAEHPDAYVLHYGIAAAPTASAAELQHFHSASYQQVTNIPSSVSSVVLPLGSGNTGAGVLWGLEERAPNVGTVHLMCIGPDRTAWLDERMRVLLDGKPRRIQVVKHALHPGFANYGDSIRASLRGISMHPRYEGKIVSYLDLISPLWWERPDEHLLFWIVGSELPRRKGSRS